MITVNTNMSSIIAQNSLYKSTNKMNTALQRLSTGLRINSAKDDAAGSAISTKLEYKVSSYDVAKDNAQMGQSMLDTANSTLSKVNSMLQRIRDLSEQAANGTYGDDERKAMQSEIDALTEEIYRIKNTTEFNGKKILGEEESPKTNKMTEAEAIAQGFTVVKNAKELYSAFHNADGTQKLDAKVALFADIDLNELGDLDGKGSNWEPIGNYSKDLTTSAFKGKLNGNGYTISNLKLNNQAKYSRDKGLFGCTRSATLSNINIKNFNIKESENNKTDCIGGLVGCEHYSLIENCTVEGVINNGSTRIGLLCGQTYNSIIKNCNAYGKITNATNSAQYIGGLIGLSIKMEMDNCYTNSNIEVSNSQEKSIGAIIGCIQNTQTIKNTGCDLDKSGVVDFFGEDTTQSTLTNIFNSKINPFLPKEISISTNLQVGINSSNDSVINVDTGFSLDDFKVSVLSEFSARNALDKIDNLMAKVSDKMTDIGATQNRIESVLEFQEVQRQALTSANSLIKDADIALESANYIKNQILQSVTSSILATANQNPQIALQLI